MVEGRQTHPSRTSRRRRVPQLHTKQELAADQQHVYRRYDDGPAPPSPTLPSFVVDSSRPEEIIVTKTVVLAEVSGTLVPALGNDEAPPQMIGSNQRPAGQLSPGTQHLLIAAGSIGSTMVLVLIVYAVFLTRKKGMTIGELFSKKARQAGAARRGQAAYPNMLDANYPYEYSASSKGLPIAMQRSMSRQTSTESERPLVGYNSNRSVQQQAIPSYDRPVQNGYYQPDIRGNQNGHARNVSETPSSVVLPLQGRQINDSDSDPSSRHTRDFDPYTGQPMEQVNKSPPTFRQFLANRRVSAVPKVSRFSWNTSNASQTPRTPRDEHRVSVATSRSSVPRFRTVDSWVGQQTNRVQAALDHDDDDTPSRRRQERGMSQFPVPDVPPEYIQEPAAPAPLRLNRQMSGKKISPRDSQFDNDDGKLSRYGSLRRDTIGGRSDATVFRQHPGTEVILPGSRRVPSAELNVRVGNLAGLNF